MGFHAGSVLFLSRGYTCSGMECECSSSVITKAHSDTTLMCHIKELQMWILINSRLCFLTSRASVMMQPITAHTRKVASMSSFCSVDFSWSIGTSQAPMAGVAVLNKFNCLQQQQNKSRTIRDFFFCYSSKWTCLITWCQCLVICVVLLALLVSINYKMCVYLDMACICERMLVGAAKLNQISFIVSFILLESGGGGSKGRSFFRSSDSTPSSCTDQYS